MEPLPLTPPLRRKVSRVFGDSADLVERRLLESCGWNLPLIAKQGELGIERTRASVLKLSEGSLERLERFIERANRDWRDVMVWAGFGNDVHAHQRWLAD